MTERLSRLWKDGETPAAFSGQTLFNRHTNAPSQLIRREILPSIVTYQKFRAAKRPRTYNPYYVRTKRKILQSDIVFMDQPKSMIRMNRGYKYVLIVQDIFSRKIWVKPLKTKAAKEVEIALSNILREMQPFSKSARFVIDRGTEYLNRSIRTLLNSYHISITHPSDGHASHVERANLSLQRLLFQRMEEIGRRKWVDFLESAAGIMNKRHHRIIRMSPEKAELAHNRNKVIEAMSIYTQKAQSQKKKIEFSVGDQVRLMRDKNKFNRGYHPTFTDEVFRVKNILSHLPVPMYEVEEWDGTPIEGNFYAEELSLVLGDVFKVERIIRRKVRNGVRSAYVKWEGFPAKYNSWVAETDIVN